MPPVPWEAVIGLEVHVQLRTETKLFCRCPNRYGAPPNTLTCPVCLGYPGALPFLQSEAVERAVELALALGARVARHSTFARKQYFYPDLPKGYQITQLDPPLATGGALPFRRGAEPLPLERLHLEEDAGKLVHDVDGGSDGGSGVDFNRAGVPLVEVVTQPALHSPADARRALQAFHRLLLHSSVGEARLEEGGLRCDANLSLRPADSPRLGDRTEIKNLNSFRHLEQALEHEVERQRGILEGGGRVAPETRGFDAGRGVTFAQRAKEGAEDYRYLPEPDLPPLVLGGEHLVALRESLPETPWALEERLARTHGLDADQAALVAAEPRRAAYFEAAVAAYPGPATALAPWLGTEVLGELNRRGEDLDAAPAPERLAALVSLVDDGTLTGTAAKEVLATLWDEDAEPAELVDRLGLAAVRDDRRLGHWVDEVLAAHPDEVRRYGRGKRGLLGFFIGRVMGRSGGRADPQRVRQLLARALDEAVKEDGP